MRFVRPLSVAAVAAAALGGCGGSGHPATAPTTATATTVVASATTGSTLLRQNPIPTSVANVDTKRKDVVLTGCAAIPGGWSASGSALNPTKSTLTYKITVFFTTTAATDIDYAVTTVTVKPGVTQHWTASKVFSAPASMLCVLTGVA